jgi:hypothetical protein
MYRSCTAEMPIRPILEDVISAKGVSQQQLVFPVLVAK